MQNKLSWPEAFRWTLIDSDRLTGQLPTLSSVDLKLEQQRIELIYHRLKSNPSSLNDLINTVSYKRLGIYFEYLIRFWIEQDPKYTLLVHDLQIQHDKRTIGALDFLVRANDGVVEHWEAAFKFYLNDKGVYIGPNRNDSLIAKQNKMATRQLALSDREETLIQLSKMGIERPMRKRVILNGCLFEHWSKCLNPNEDYFWCHHHEWEEIKGQLNQHYSILEKPKLNWLFPSTEPCLIEHKCKTPIDSQQPKQYAIMLLRDTKMIEINRFFCVPNGWSDQPFQQR